MIYILFFIVCFGASVVGAICGIGGGVIIKPVLDSFGVLSVTAISFLSGCTVLSMTTYSVLRNKLDKGAALKGEQDHAKLPLALGAAVGGLLGKEMFSYVKSLSDDPNRVGAVQAACLLVVTIGTLLYTIYKSHIRTHQVKNMMACVLIGLFLGIMSSFLGIGGGPINLVVLFFFFSMTTKEAAEISLYIIFFSQAASLLSTIVTGAVPSVELGLLLLMVAGGILGGVCGRSINKKIDEKTVDKLFIGLMVVMILINIYNIYKYL
ncbi:MAG: sulfite exporter TauE/SafE family protein [Lachnospiraceae bacterium]|nr:sulfite exporter TauE/SafE family protein [Lachnospiraceae bacterium]